MARCTPFYRVTGPPKWAWGALLSPTAQSLFQREYLPRWESQKEFR
ncbi:hypothetical protein FBY34_7986 [Streptomyces sp. SLBN-115]|nr:hypothetical protein FBY34_7986 [Streptomyces sp. SLBN-115]